MNRVVLMGRLTRDPEIRWTQGQDQRCQARFTLAVDRKVKKTDAGQQTADFISCAAFGKMAEFMEKYYRQGLKVVVSGRIRTGSYTNRDGVKVYTTDVIVDEQDFAESKKNDGSQDSPRQNREQGSGYRDEQGNYHDGYGSYDSRKDGEGFMDIPEGAEEGLPFS